MPNQRERAYQHIRDAITYGTLKPGEQLIDTRISKMFGIGRTPIREALRQLQMEGLIDVLPNKGAFVSKISMEDIKQIYDIVAILEGFATEIATKNIRPSDKKKLLGLHKDLQEAAKAKNYREWLEKNALFHGYFCKAVGNRYLVNVIDGLRRRVYRYRFMSVTVPRGIEDYLSAHQEILSAVSQGKPTQAGAAMRRHVLDVKRVLVEFLQHFPGI